MRLPCKAAHVAEEGWNMSLACIGSLESQGLQSGHVSLIK